ncbi:TetR/AcrR family transcriptional regulator [Streptococcus sp. DD13]|uniref:TetR/AcrR family transcriptional regulator n=1 Tax=Streptococcus sp. DD13 TaxID=1777881 RepID=UPI0007982461|nr:TetR/AcrR family transcriptional regulator [Streptococcus sp. DD13]KXT78245.1 Transcriptional regulator, TetR family [Streptococcus sp. DD13]
MDRRITRTKRAIYQAFVDLLNEKGYGTMTVQDIIDRADVGRSTFYMHYESKETLLDALCQELFHHIFMKKSTEDLEVFQFIEHIMVHFKENQDKIASLFLSDNASFMLRLKEEIAHHIYPLVADDYLSGLRHLPQDFVKNYVVTTFTETVKWWLRQRKRLSESTITHYFLDTLHA